MIDFPIFYELRKIMAHAICFTNNTRLLFCARGVMKASKQILDIVIGSCSFPR